MIIDSSIWIALRNKRDKWHHKSQELKPVILDLSEFYITDNILTETYNFLLRRVSYKAAITAFEQFIANTRCHILFNNKGTSKETLQLLHKYPQLSYTDANMVWHAKDKEIYRIMSFDAGFDGIDKIIRVFQPEK